GSRSPTRKPRASTPSARPSISCTASSPAEMTRERRRVVVTGLGAISPVGRTMPATWEAIVAGTSGAGPITLFDTTEHKVSIAAEVSDFEPTDYFEAKEARRLDRCSQFALVAAGEAMTDAGLRFDPDSEE